MANGKNLKSLLNEKHDREVKKAAEERDVGIGHVLRERFKKKETAPWQTGEDGFLCYKKYYR